MHIRSTSLSQVSISEIQPIDRPLPALVIDNIEESIDSEVFTIDSHVDIFRLLSDMTTTSSDNDHLSVDMVTYDPTDDWVLIDDPYTVDYGLTVDMVTL